MFGGAVAPPPPTPVVLMFFVSFQTWLFLAIGFCQFWLLLANFLWNLAIKLSEIWQHWCVLLHFREEDISQYLAEMSSSSQWPFSRAGLRGGNGGNYPGPPASRGPPWWQLFVLNKILVWKIVIQKRYKNTNLYSDAALGISIDFSTSLTFCRF